MQAPVDPELITAGVYGVVVPVYFVLWRRHSRNCYAVLEIAALNLTLCAMLKSDAVRAWDPHPLNHPGASWGPPGNRPSGGEMGPGFGRDDGVELSVTSVKHPN